MMMKKISDDVSDQKNIEILTLSRKLCYILPKNNLNYYVQHGLFESGLIEWCKQFCNKTMLDIGAHTGTYALSLAKYCDKVYAFEPQRMTYYALCGGVALSNIKNIICYNFGLGDKTQEGINKLKIISEDGGGSTLHPTKHTILAEEDIEIKTLDDMNIRDINFIKMDVEGNELSVLKGGIKTIELNNPTILFESNDGNKDLFDFIISLNYDIIKINGISNMFLAKKKMIIS